MHPEEELLPRFESRSTLDNSQVNHALRNAPVFTYDAFQALGKTIFPQRALYGQVTSTSISGLLQGPSNSKLCVNTNAPFSALVCGVQGSGKSHSTSVLLESCLIRDPRLGTLPSPMSGLVFYFDSSTSARSSEPCEAAYIAVKDVQRGGDLKTPLVKVLVMPNHLKSMRKVYAPLPGVRVEPLQFSAADITAERLLKMMRVNTEHYMPLYMEAVLTEMRSKDPWNYKVFRKDLDRLPLNSNQRASLKLRLNLLDECLKDNCNAQVVPKYFKPGTLTIIDLSSPYVDAATASCFFDLILGIFVELDASKFAKILVLDEAHKYLSESSPYLGNSLLSVVRQQRHLNMRTVISTQEPTIVPGRLINLCSFVLAHRFSSPQWMKHLLQHVANGQMSNDLFSKMSTLYPGEAVLFAPSGVGLQGGTQQAPLKVGIFGQGHLIVRSRLRVTFDGGQSRMAVTNGASCENDQSVKYPSGSLIETLDGAALQPQQSPTDKSGQFGPLVQFLAKKQVEGMNRVYSGVIGAEKAIQVCHQGKLGTFLEAAQNAHLVKLTSKGGSYWVELAGHTASNQNNEIWVTEPTNAKHDTLFPLLQRKGKAIPGEYAQLAAFLRQKRRDGTLQVSYSVLEAQRNLYGCKKLRPFLVAAQAAGVITMGMTRNKAWAQLV